MNIFIHELRSYRKSTIIWSLSLSALVVLYLMMYPAFTKDVVASQKIIASLPLAVRDALGISLKNFFTIFGFFSYMLSFLMLGAAIQATNLGVGVISKEESGKTADFLLTKPVSRTRLVTSKLLAAFTLLVMTNVVLITVSLFTVRAVASEDVSYKLFMLIVLTVILVQIAFLAIGSLLSVVVPKIKSVIMVSIPTVFAFYVVGTIGSILDSHSFRYITPFKFYDTNFVITNGKYEVRYLVTELILVIIAIALTYIIFAKKDINSA